MECPEIKIQVKIDSADMEEIRLGFAKMMARIEALEQEIARRPVAPVPPPTPAIYPGYAPYPLYPYQPIITC